MAAESERIRRETEHHLQRIREQTAQEIELMTRGAIDELRKYSAELALGLAEQRIRSRMNPATQDRVWWTDSFTICASAPLRGRRTDLWHPPSPTVTPEPWWTLCMAPGSPLKPEDAVAQLRAVEPMIQESRRIAQRAADACHSNFAQARRDGANCWREPARSPLIRNFIYVVIDHRRIAMIGEIREAFELQLDERLGFVRAEVTSAAALDQARLGANLESELSRLTGKRMRLRFDVDPALLGGVVARIGSTVYDGSVRGELRQLAKKAGRAAGLNAG